MSRPGGRGLLKTCDSETEPLETSHPKQIVNTNSIKQSLSYQTIGLSKVHKPLVQARIWPETPLLTKSHRPAFFEPVFGLVEPLFLSPKTPSSPSSCPLWKAGLPLSNLVSQL